MAMGMASSHFKTRMRVVLGERFSRASSFSSRHWRKRVGLVARINHFTAERRKMMPKKKGSPHDSTAAHKNASAAPVSEVIPREIARRRHIFCSSGVNSGNAAPAISDPATVSGCAIGATFTASLSGKNTCVELGGLCVTASELPGKNGAASRSVNAGTAPSIAA